MKTIGPLGVRDIQDTVAVFPLKTAKDVIDQAPRIVSQFDVVVADGPAGLSERFCWSPILVS